MSDDWNLDSEAKPDDLDFWRLCDELSVYEATLLIIGQSPGKLVDVERWNFEKRPRGYEAAKTAIRNALRSGKINGTIEPDVTNGFNGDPEPIFGTVNLYSSRVLVELLGLGWLTVASDKVSFFRNELKRRTILTLPTPATRPSWRPPFKLGWW